MTTYNRSKLWRYRSSCYAFIGIPTVRSFKVPERETAFELNERLRQYLGVGNVFEVQEGYFQFCNLTEEEIEAGLSAIPWNAKFDQMIDDADFQEMTKDAES